MGTYPGWLAPLRVPLLGEADVHVWLAELEQPEHTLQQLTSALDKDELFRARRFHFERDRRHFIIARGVLRGILGSYLKIPPAQVSFVYGPRGKPALAPDDSNNRLRFNVSHSHELALFAVARDREIGVDIEWMRPLEDAEQIATRFFSAREQAELRNLPHSLKHQGFYNCWTRKEAYIKAIGEGLYQALDEFDVSLTPGEPVQLLSVLGKPEEAKRWLLQAVQAPAGYAAALAVEGADWHLRCWKWEEALTLSW